MPSFKRVGMLYGKSGGMPLRQEFHYQSIFVATLALGSRPNQKEACKVASQEKAWESHRMFLGV
jgi:hypothetical protein